MVTQIRDKILDYALVIALVAGVVIVGIVDVEHSTRIAIQGTLAAILGVVIRRQFPPALLVAVLGFGLSGILGGCAGTQIELEPPRVVGGQVLVEEDSTSPENHVVHAGVSLEWMSRPWRLETHWYPASSRVQICWKIEGVLHGCQWYPLGAPLETG